jgi:hypothetical protein
MAAAQPSHEHLSQTHPARRCRDLEGHLASGHPGFPFRDHRLFGSHNVDR